MDHISPVINPHRAVQVPYLGGVYSGDRGANYPQRSGVAFADYPESEGWSLSHLQQGRLFQKHGGKFYERSPLEVERFLQAWLYFGMIQEILGMAIPTADFVRLDESKASFITTEKLRSYLHRWKVRIDSDRALGLRETWSRRDQRITECLAFSYDFWKGITESVKNCLLPPEIELSIQILAMTLEHAVTSVCEIPVEMAPWRLARSHFVTNRMIEDGWCPSVVEQIWYPSHLTLQYYASLLGPPEKRLRHDDCAAGDSGCKAKNTVDSQYRTKHMETGCDCSAIAIDLKKLAQIIQDGGLPVLCLDYDGSKPYLEVVPLREGMHYTAISHV
ncbi:hypothetical protein MMC28_001707 [Mycoblastus sanguinarius]|nr:hypothetical protein [Mycoblastus sanguinarius]